MSPVWMRTRTAPHRSTRLILASSLALVTLAAGCQRDVVKPPPTGRADLLPASRYPNIVATDGLQPALVFGEAKVDPGTDQMPMSVTVPVRSLEDEHPVNVQYKFEFFDAEGEPLESNRGWRFMNLTPRLQKFMRATALETKAADWRLTVRSAR